MKSELSIPKRGTKALYRGLVNMKKIGKMKEAAWLLYNVMCALGVVLCTKASFGLSMIAAPPYILHTVLSKSLSFFTQGNTEYVFQGCLLILVCILIKKVKLRIILSFITSLFFGVLIDLWAFALGGNGAYEELWTRIIAFIIGEILIAMSIALCFRSYLPPQVSELVVTEVAKRYKFDINRVKLVSDASYFTLSLVLSLTLTGGLTGIGVGTVIVTLINSHAIRLSGKLLDKLFVFDPLFPKLEEFFTDK